MRKRAATASVVELVSVVSGRSNDYVMAIEDGRIVLTGGESRVGDDTRLVSYHDQQGNTIQVNHDGVSQVTER